MTTTYCCGFMFRGYPGEEEVLLIHKLKPAWQAGKCNGIGGKLEASETPIMAMCREFMEETGIVTVPSEWREFCVTEHHQFDGVVHFFTTRARPHYTARSMEAEPVVWVPVGALYGYHLIQNLHWLIPMAMDPDKVEARVIDRSIK